VLIKTYYVPSFFFFWRQLMNITLTIGTNPYSSLLYNTVQREPYSTVPRGKPTSPDPPLLDQTCSKVVSM